MGSMKDLMLDIKAGTQEEPPGRPSPLAGDGGRGRRPLSTGELALAGNVLQEIRQKEVWLQCDCVSGEIRNRFFDQNS